MAEIVFPDPDEPIPYYDLSPEQKHAPHTWLIQHRVQPGRVPVYARFDRDEATSEWRIPVYWHDADGRMSLNPDGESVRKHLVRRRELRPLPWPTWSGHAEFFCGDPDCSCGDEPDDDAGHGDDWPPIVTVDTGGLL